MHKSLFFCLSALLLLLSVTHADDVQEAKLPPSTLLSNDHLQAAIHASRRASHPSFSGTYRGSFDSLGMKGTFDGSVSGKTRRGRTTGKFDGRSRGTVNVLGSKGKIFSSFSGTFVSVGKGKNMRIRHKGRFTFRYVGRYAGKPHVGNIVGTFSGTIGGGKMSFKERGRVRARILRMQFIGNYKASFRNNKFSFRARGTLDGKRFTAKHAIMYEGMDKLFKTMGSYNVKAGGKTYTGKFNQFGMVPPN